MSDGDDENRQRRPRYRPQAARGIRVQREFPPQIIAILALFIGKNCQADGAYHHQQHSHRPLRRKSIGQQRAFAIKMLPARRQRHEHDREKNRLLIVESLEQRRQDSRCQRQHRQPIRRIDPPLQPPG